jgi:hypothetical protein
MEVRLAKREEAKPKQVEAKLGSSGSRKEVSPAALNQPQVSEVTRGWFTSSAG